VTNLEHHLFSLTFDRKLFTAPIPKEQQIRHVLDVGTGTGSWAIDFGLSNNSGAEWLIANYDLADEYPEAQVC
jgi:ubiquinone/menaquinone biosynthesis C-methylase UbiE